MGAHKYDAKDDDDDDLSVCYIIKHLRVFPSLKESENKNRMRYIMRGIHGYIKIIIFLILIQCVLVYT